MIITTAEMLNRHFLRGMCSVCQKTRNASSEPRPKIKTRKGEAKTVKRRDHQYFRLFPWKNLEEFTCMLYDNIIYEDENLIAINKPPGVPKEKNDPKKKFMEGPIVQTLHSSLGPECRFSLTEALPRLGEKLKVKDLQIVRMAERYISGVSLLAVSENAAARIKKCILRAKPQQFLCDHYWAVTLGRPLDKMKFEHVGISLVGRVKGTEEQKQVIIDRNISKTRMKNQEVKPASVEYRVLDVNREVSVSLVAIFPSVTKNNFIKVYMADQLSPVLGDSLYGGRVKHILGKPVALNPFKAQYGCQNISKDIFSRLQLQPSEVSVIPSHIHLYQLTLLEYHGKEKHLTLTASLPEYFVWTCNKLELITGGKKE